MCFIITYHTVNLLATIKQTNISVQTLFQTINARFTRNQRAIRCFCFQQSLKQSVSIEIVKEEHREAEEFSFESVTYRL